MREGPEIADPAVDVELAVRGDPQQTVEPVRSGIVVALADADADHLVAVALSGELLFLLPIEQLRALVERLLHKSADDRALMTANFSAVVEGVDLADRYAFYPRGPGRL